MAARKVQLKDNSGNKAYPVTSSACVGMSDGSENLDEKISGIISNSGYVTCTEAAGTAAKTVTQANFMLSTNCRLIVKMANYNTAASPTLNVNNTGAKPLYYNGEAASADNTWEAGEVLDVYYDGTNYQASNIQGGAGAGGNQILEWTTDAATTRLQVTQRKRKKGMSVTYVNDKNETVNEQYIKNVFDDNEWKDDNNWVRYSMYRDARIREVRSGGYRCIGHMEIQKKDFNTQLLLPAKMILNHSYAVYMETNFKTSRFTASIYGSGLGDRTYPFDDCNVQNGYMFEFTNSSSNFISTILVNDSLAEISESDTCGIWVYDLNQTVSTALDEAGALQLSQYPFNYRIIAQIKKKFDISYIYAHSGNTRNYVTFTAEVGNYNLVTDIHSDWPQNVILHKNAELSNEKKYLFQCCVNTGDTRMGEFYVDAQYGTVWKNVNGQDGLDSTKASAYNAVLKPGFNYMYTPEPRQTSGDLNGFRFNFSFNQNSDKWAQFPEVEVELGIYEILETAEDVIKSQDIVKRIMQTLGMPDTYEMKFIKNIDIELDVTTSSTTVFEQFDFGLGYEKGSREKVYLCKFTNNLDTPLPINHAWAVAESGGVITANCGMSYTANPPLYNMCIFEAGKWEGQNQTGREPNAIAFTVVDNYTGHVDITAELYEIRIKSSLHDGLVNVTYSPDKHLPVGLTRLDLTSESITVNENHTLSGIPAGNVGFKYTFDTGKVFECKAEVDYQGNISMSFDKKNLKVDLLDDLGESVKLRIGTWLPMDSFHFKANWIDSMHCRNIISARIMEQIYLSRGERPWDSYNDYEKDDLLGRIETGALGHVDGFPVEIYVNNTYIGLYTFNLNKNRSNYNMKKDDTNHIQIQMGGYLNWSNDPLNWGSMEIRNPKGDSGNEEFTENVEPNPGEVKTAIERFAAFCNGATLPAPTYTKEDFADYLNIPFWIDFLLFSDFIGNNDFLCGNTQICTWDGLHWSPLPYDMDASFGSTGFGLGTYDFISSDSDIYSSNNGQPIIKKIEEYYMDDMVKRYAELRALGIFSVGNVNKLISDFMVNIGEDGYEKEHELWPNTPSNGGDSSYVWYNSKGRMMSFIKAKILHMDFKYKLMQTRLY